MASDRFLRIFNPNTKKIISRVSKAKLPKSDPESKPTHLFHDDTIKTFFRRLTFSPDGELLIVPSGLIEQPGKNSSNSTLIFSRKCFNKPVVYLPSMNQYTVVARCCPTLFTLRPMTNDQPLFDLQYRIVIAVATQRSVLLYDTQHAAPIALITNIHYTRITDLTWSSDGKILVISSTDGYCSFITFTEGELGDLYDRTKEIKVINTKHDEKMDTSNKDDHKELKTVGENDCTKTDIDNTLSFQGKISPLKKSNDFKLPTYVAVPETKKSIEIKEKAGIVNLETKMDVDDDFHLIYEDTTESKLAADESKKVNEEKIEDKKNEKETIAVVKKNNEENRCVEDNANKAILSELSPVKGDKEESFVSPKCSENVTPGQSQKNKTPRRVQLITLSSPKSKKKLL
uniref:CAF1B/HIR1 beta-propeller domain-containing protein n=1 Tax=Clastoptera arizonana TaxID=38151 RepID=A0A1B6D4T7_9HEMI